MSKKSLFFIGLLALLFFAMAVLAKMPAGFAVNQALKLNPNLTIAQVSGTIWQGQAGYVAVRQFGKPIVLGKVNWHIAPLSLLMGRTDVNLNATHGQQRISGDFTLHMDKTIEARDAELRADAALLRQIYPVIFKPEGFAELDIRELSLKAMEVQALDASLVLRDLFVTVQQRVELGTYGAKLSLEDQAVRADVSDIDGQVEIGGFGRFSPKSREYQVDLKLKPKTTAAPAIGQSLAFVSKKQSDGSFVVKMKQKM